MIESSGVWQGQRQHWTAVYQHQLLCQVQQLVIQIRENRQTRANLKPHFDSILTILQQAWPVAALRPYCLDMVELLHPYPVYWMRGEAWQAQLERAIIHAAEMGESRRELLFTAELAHLLWRMGRIPAAAAVGKRAVQLGDGWQTAVLRSYAGYVAVFAMTRGGESEQAGPLLAELFARLEADRPQLAHFQYVTAWAYLCFQEMRLLRLAGRMTDALTLATQVVTAVRTNHSQLSLELLVKAYQYHMIFLWLNEQNDQALLVVQKVIALYEEMGDTVLQVYAIGEMGLIYYAMARYDEAEIAIRRSIAMAEQCNVLSQAADEVGNLAAIYMARGDMPTALRYVNCHWEMSLQLNDTGQISRAISNRSYINMQLGRYDEALPEMLESLAQLNGRGYKVIVTLTHFLLATLYHQVQNEEQRDHHVQLGIELMADLDSPAHTLVFLRMRAYFLPTSARRPLLEQSLQMARKLHKHLDEAVALLWLAGTAPTPAEQEAIWQEGAAILHRIGATYWLHGRSIAHPPFV